MARQARVVIPGCPHHVTHRDNRRQEVFFFDDDRRFDLEMLRQCAERFGVQIWTYCLMGNHVHLIVVPQREDGKPGPKPKSEVDTMTGDMFGVWYELEFGGKELRNPSPYFLISE